MAIREHVFVLPSSKLDFAMAPSFFAWDAFGTHISCPVSNALIAAQREKDLKACENVNFFGSSFPAYVPCGA